VIVTTNCCDCCCVIPMTCCHSKAPTIGCCLTVPTLSARMIGVQQHEVRMSAEPVHFGVLTAQILAVPVTVVRFALPTVLKLAAPMPWVRSASLMGLNFAVP
jgi:hypothetical protein